MKELKLVVAAALVDDLENPTRMLAARRSKPAQIAGRWEFPGGKAELGETPEQALHRELREELGIKVELGKEIVGPDDGGWIITDRHIMRLWYARIIEGEPQPLVEHDLLEWAYHRRLLGPLRNNSGKAPAICVMILHRGTLIKWENQTGGGLGYITGRRQTNGGTNEHHRYT